MNHKVIFVCAAVFAGSFGLLAAACDDGTSGGTSSGNPFTPAGDSGPSTSSGNPDSGPTTTDGGCLNTPANCFCGTPTTQVQFLNRCTKATALPVTVTAPPASTTDIP